MMKATLILLLFSLILTNIDAFTNEGIRVDTLTSYHNETHLSKDLYKGAQAFITINCETKETNKYITLNWAIFQSDCWYGSDPIENPIRIVNEKLPQNISMIYKKSLGFKCNDHVDTSDSQFTGNTSLHPRNTPSYIFKQDGVYVLGVGVAINDSSYNVTVKIEIKSSYGYLNASDWPLLHFYMFMCIYYVILGVIWLTLSFLQWRDLLRVQFWIGGVILLGMLEKATFYHEYQSINNTGIAQGAIIIAEWVSCAKRTLARILVVIVSLGFGIVKPRLGATLHRVMGVGLLYFILAASEAYLRNANDPKETVQNLRIASIPLAVLDSAICWWIFSALVNTTRTLRLRRNETKLTLYRRFTNTLIFAVIASIFFMLYSMKVHLMASCITVWKDIWLEQAYWQILFSILLSVIMILWRPTNNNQRYAFVPLLDTGDDEEEEQLVSDAYGVKIRVHKPKTSTPPTSRNSVDEDLKWLEENVKDDLALPVLDSDEELANARFEMSKMQ